MQYAQPSTTLSGDLCPDFMGNAGQTSFLFHISQQFLHILEVMNVDKSKLRRGRCHFTFNKDEKCEMDVIFSVITMRGRGISIS